ncbi:MAG: Chaperone protein DnaJ [Chlamydiales bacterium]|nr:Chaperone protein DnaJ [Chlamydiales bacterium]
MPIRFVGPYGASPYINAADNLSKIYKETQTQLRFKNRIVTYQQYKEEYHSVEGNYSNNLFSRKFTALPKAFFCGVVKTTYHLAKAILIGILANPFDNRHHFCRNIFCIARDFQESFGNIAILFNDCFGRFHVDDAKFEKACYTHNLSKIPCFDDKMNFKPDPEPFFYRSSSNDSSSSSSSDDDDDIHNFFFPKNNVPKYSSNRFSNNDFVTDAHIRRIFEERFFNAGFQFPQRSFPNAFPAGPSPFFSSQSGPSGFNFGSSFNFENVPSSTSPKETNYSILGLSENASPKEIKSAYHNLVKQYHPDKVSKLPAHDYEKRLEESTDKFRKIDQAYKALT